MARNWQKMAAIRRKRIILPRTSGEVDADVADKGHFVVYTSDRIRFVVPLVYLDNVIFRELFQMAEEEFGLPGNGPIILPCDAVFMEYAVSLIQRHVAKDLEKALLMSIAADRCSSSSYFHQDQSNPHTTSSRAEKGHFVVYTIDQTRFVFPIVYLSNHIFRELFKMSEEEFGLPRDGPIMLPCDAVFMNYVVFLIKRRVTKDMEKALLMSMATSQCSRCHSLFQEESSQHVLLRGF
uniref:Auxin-responsive protein SAUR66 n=1 Tax=Vitis vinifera TaxID=29760 RepID=F6I0T9_VITVI